MSEEAALLELDVQLEFRDYLRFQYYDSLRKLWWTVPFFGLAALVSVVLVIISAYNQDYYLLQDVTPFTSLVFLGALFLFAAPYLSSKREFEVNAALRQRIHYTLHEHMLETVSPRRKGKLPWAKVSGARETGTAFFLYIAPSGAFILPKREFPSEAEVSAFRELLFVILGANKCNFTLDRISSKF